MVATLSIVGAGRVGKTLGRLWLDAGRIQVLQIVNQSIASSAAAARFIGQGTPAEGVQALEPAELIMLATTDTALAGCARELASSGVVAPDTVVFHCSGAVGLEVLAPVERAGARIARLHALRSFSSSQRAVWGFPGTYCGLEGDPRATTLLEALVRASGGQTFRMPESGAVFHHASAVLVSNYLVALFEAAVRTSVKAGFSRSQASAMLQGLVHSTLDNVVELGTVAALTGPIARGDADVVRTQLDALLAADPEVALVYRSLGRLALDLSERQGSAPPASLALIQQVLQAEPQPRAEPD